VLIVFLTRSDEFLTKQQQPCIPVRHSMLRFGRELLQEVPVVLIVFGNPVDAVLPEIQG
jgi:hypothetical protein